MLLSHSHRFLFVHTIRAAGTAIAQALEPYSHRPPEGKWNRYLSKMGLVRDPTKIRLREHETALGAQKLLPPEVFDSYFKFAFVRNPWSWLVSVWMRLRTTESHRHHAAVAPLTFPQYVAWEIERNQRHQHLFVCNERGKIIVDFVGRIENLKLDFDAVCRQITVVTPELTKVGARKREHEDYRVYYDDALRETVARHWQRDIELFGYAFDPAEGILPPIRSTG